MSGVFDKKTEKVSKREERVLREQKEKKKTRIIAITTVVVFAILVAGSLVLNSKFIRRKMPAINIGGVNFTAAEFDYFFYNAYYEYSNMIYQQFGDSASSMLPTTGKPLKSQPYPYAEEAETWADVFILNATEQMSEIVQIYNAARAAGFEMPAETAQLLEEDIANLRMYADAYGYPSLDAFIQQNFGASINEATYRKALEFTSYASAYSEHVNDSFEYSAGELADYYNEHRDEYDTFTFRYFLYRVDTVSEADYDSTEDYEAAKEAAQAECLAKAEDIVAGIFSEDDFVAAAHDYDHSQFEDPASTLKVYPGSWLGNYYGPWLKESGRAYGDVSTADSAGGTYIVFYIDRDSNEYNLVEMRQILVMREEVDPEMLNAEDIDVSDLLSPDFDADAAYELAVAKADERARIKAETALSLFEEGGATEDALLGLMEEYSDDTAEGGFYDLISKDASQNKMILEVENWLFAPGRKYGDYGIVRSEDYGYHLLFFMGFGERLCDYLADTNMRKADFADWKASLAPVESNKLWGFVLTSN